MIGWVAVALLMTAFAGIWRTVHGPSTADRILGVQMMGTVGIALLLVLSQWQQLDIWRDVALVLALLASVITVAMVQLLRGAGPSDDESQEGL
jgi:multicomponent Na+:H+ antiporter subunit F